MEALGEEAGWKREDEGGQAMESLGTGVSVHTGYAKGKMVNASRLAVEFQNMIPENESASHPNSCARMRRRKIWMPSWCIGVPRKRSST